MTKIHHVHLYGTRDSKYDWLQHHDVLSTDWQEVKPQAPFYLMIPQNTDLLSEYEQGWKIAEVMPVNSTGVKTHRDHFVIDFDAEKLKNRITEFRDLTIPDEVISQRYSLSDTRDWKISVRRRFLAANDDWKKYLTKCLYRPFDVREYYHHQDVVELPRNEVMRHFLGGKNVGLIATRQTRDEWNVLVASFLCVHKSCAAYDTNSVFPLYLYPDRNSLTQECRPNFSPEFLKDLTAKLGYTPTPEVIFYYIYAVFHAPTYRERYAEFLKIDFPRVPLTRNDELFQKLTAYGEELVALHLMTSPKLDSFITQFEGNSNLIVDAGHPKFIPLPSAPLPARARGAGENGKVVINKKGDGFTGIPEAVWNFYIGGYQVCHKWLKDRKGRTLSDDDILHYQRIVVVLKETITLMQKIDDAIPSWPIE